MGKDKIIYLNWEQYLRDIESLIEVLKKKCKLSEIMGVYGVPRGGLIPAAIISHHLSIPYINLSLLNYDNYIFDNKKFLIIDEISDSGKTVKTFRSQFGDMVEFASVYVRYNCEEWPNYYFSKILTDDWIKFPYES